MHSKILPALSLCLFLFLSVIQPNVVALDDVSSLRCEDGIIVSGDSQDKVREKCGEPQQILQPDPQEPTKWVYDFGSTQFTYYVSIVNNKVERIQAGDAGD